MSNDQAFDMPMVRGLGQIGPAAGGGDPGNSLYTSSDPSAPGSDTSNLLGPGGADPTYSGTTVGSGGTSGGGGYVGPAASTGTATTPGSVSSALSSITTGNGPLIIGAIAVIGGIAGVAYLAHRKHVQGGGAKGARSRRSRYHSHSRRYARR